MNHRARLFALTPYLFILIVLGASPGCQPQMESASVEELGQMNRDFAAALNAGDAKAAAAAYTEDAVLIPPGEDIVRGRANIEAYWRAALEEGGMRDASVETIDARSSGDLGYEVGTFVLTVNGPDGEAIVDSGRYVELLRLESDGKWYSTLGFWNASAP